MRNFTRRGDQFSIQIKPDEERFTGRECPIDGCQGYFKIQVGTGLKGEVHCHCPYCGYTAPHDQFWTKEQIEYAQSVVMHEITDEFLYELKKMERRPNPKALFSIGVEVKGRPHPIHYYREKRLEQEVVCDQCTLRYAIYGVFGFCPDCGVHNSPQILNTNLNVIEKMLKLSNDVDPEIATKLIENALEDAVSSVDGFGREICKVHSIKAIDTNKAQNISFQNILKARELVKELFSIDIAESVDATKWNSMTRSFQKRHLIAHKMGVVDQDYIDRTGDSSALLGRKISINSDEVKELVEGLRTIGEYLASEFESL